MLETGSVQKLREITNDLFIDDELEVYNHIIRHFRRYHRLPAIATVEEELARRLPDAVENTDYYHRRVVDRKLYGHVRDSFDLLRDSLRNNNMDSARQAIASMHTASRTVTHDHRVVNLRVASSQMLEAYDEAHRTPGMTGIPSGWAGFDEQTGGYQNGDLVSWVARLGVGKTNVILKQADYAWDQGHSVLVVTTEMPTMQMARRLMGVRTGINPDLIRKGMLSTYARRRLGRIVDNLFNSERFNFYAAGMNEPVTDIMALVDEFSPDIVYIDGAYLLRPDSGKRYLSKQERVPEVFDALRSMALDCERPFVTTTQFSRMSGKRGKEGSIETVAFSDAIAQNSSIVVGIKEGKPPFQHTRRVFEFLKGREGETGEVTINYQFTPVNLSEADPEELQAEEVSLDWMAS
jgi:replicative DNA helicase